MTCAELDRALPDDAIVLSSRPDGSPVQHAGRGPGGEHTQLPDDEPSKPALRTRTAGSRAALDALALARSMHQRRAGWVYLKHAVGHPYHLTAVAGVLLLALVNWSALILVAGLVGEIILLTVLPKLAPFRRRVEKALEEARRAAGVKAREALVAQLGEAHRRELARLDRLVLRTREWDRERGIPLRSGLDDGLARLSANYIRLALAFRGCEEALATTNRLAVEETIRSLEAIRRVATDRMRPVVERRLGIAYKRLECSDKARENLEVIGQQLATIVELVQLMHQRAIAPIPAGDPQGDIDRFLGELEDSEYTVKELVDLGVVDAPEIEFEVLASVA